MSPMVNVPQSARASLRVRPIIPSDVSASLMGQGRVVNVAFSSEHVFEDLTPGAYTLQLSAEGFITGSYPVLLKPSEEFLLETVLTHEPVVSRQYRIQTCFFSKTRALPEVTQVVGDPQITTLFSTPTQKFYVQLLPRTDLLDMDFVRTLPPPDFLWKGNLSDAVYAPTERHRGGWHERGDNNSDDYVYVPGYPVPSSALELGSIYAAGTLMNGEQVRPDIISREEYLAALAQAGLGDGGEVGRPRNGAVFLRYPVYAVAYRGRESHYEAMTSSLTSLDDQGKSVERLLNPMLLQLQWRSPGSFRLSINRHLSAGRSLILLYDGQQAGAHNINLPNYYGVALNSRISLRFPGLGREVFANIGNVTQTTQSIGIGRHTFWVAALTRDGSDIDWSLRPVPFTVNTTVGGLVTAGVTF